MNNKCGEIIKVFKTYRITRTVFDEMQFRIAQSTSSSFWINSFVILGTIDCNVTFLPAYEASSKFVLLFTRSRFLGRWTSTRL